jgi:ABC-2 type transport system permease protein
MTALLALARADIVLYLSNRRALLVTLAAPILIAAFFGAVLGGPQTKVVRVPVAVVDHDGSAVSQAVVAAMKRDTTFDLREAAEPEAIRSVREGKARAAVVLPAGFGDGAAAALFRSGPDKPEIVVHYDPSQSMALALVNGLLAQYVMQAVSSAIATPATGRKLIADLRSDVRKNKDLDAGTRANLLMLFDSVDRVQSAEPGAGANPLQAPGLSLPYVTAQREVTAGGDRKYNSYAHAFAGMGVQFVLFMGIELGLGVLLMRRQGIWQRLRAAPISKRLLLSSRIVSGTAIACLLLVGIYAAAIAFFGVRIEGSIVGFVGVAASFALLTATFGLLIAALGRTPETTRGIAIVATLLLVMLGGAWVPTFVFPEWLQAATLVVPTRWAIDGLEAMTWRGLAADAALAPMVVMLAFSAAFALIAVLRFDWEE